nr:uncharacterized protein LOC129386579 [Dermacentor andersoni]
MAEESSSEYTPLDLSMKDKATPSTSCDGTQDGSTTSGAYNTISDDTLQYQRNTQHTPTTDETCNVDGVNDNGSTKCQHLGSVRSIDNTKPSTSRASMEEASANSEDGSAFVACILAPYCGMWKACEGETLFGADAHELKQGMLLKPEEENSKSPAVPAQVINHL